MTTRDRRLPAYLRGEPAAAGPALHKRGDVHRDQHGHVIEDYHLCGCQPSDGEALRLLRDAQPTGFEMPPVEWWRRRDAYLAARFDAYLAARPAPEADPE